MKGGVIALAPPSTQASRAATLQPVESIAAYVVLTAITVVVAWFLWGFRAVRQLDDRVLGQRGIAMVSLIATLLFIAGTVATLTQRVWGVSVIYVVLSCWCGYWTYRRRADL